MINSFKKKKKNVFISSLKKQVSIYLSCLRDCCNSFAVELQKSFVDSNTYPIYPSIEGKIVDCFNFWVIV